MTPTEPPILVSKQDARRPTLDRTAGRLAAVGAALGVLTGLLDTVTGGSIRSWVGNKLDTTGLGLATVLHHRSQIALPAGRRRPRGGMLSVMNVPERSPRAETVMRGHEVLLRR